MSNNNNKNKGAWTSSSKHSKMIGQNGKKSSLVEDHVRTIGTRPPISSHVSPIGQNMIIPKKNCFSKKRTDHDCQSCGQHYSLYY